MKIEYQFSKIEKKKTKQNLVSNCFYIKTQLSRPLSHIFSFILWLSRESWRGFPLSFSFVLSLRLSVFFFINPTSFSFLFLNPISLFTFFFCVFDCIGTWSTKGLNYNQVPSRFLSFDFSKAWFTTFSRHPNNPIYVYYISFLIRRS